MQAILSARTQAPNQSETPAALLDFDHFPIDRTAIPQERLDLVNRLRTSLFPWRGQFSPELIEILLDRYTTTTSVVLDPFLGSGTTLFEAARKSLQCTGAEINPAAIVMARTVQFANVSLMERQQYLRAAHKLIKENARTRLGGLFAAVETRHDEAGDEEIQSGLGRMVKKAAKHDRLVETLVANAVVHCMETGRDIFTAFQQVKAIVEQLPMSGQACTVLHCDARSLPIDHNAVDFIVTSPPYINVFNYHQNCRPAMELMGWDMLHVARSEFGSNRKHRGNRFLTVIQYAIDMLQALHEMRRVIRPTGRLIIVIGRESTVRGVRFQNGRLLAALSTGAQLRLIMRQERQFKNKFGENIFEDILHFVPDRSPAKTEKFARAMAEHLLSEALDETFGAVRQDIRDALNQGQLVNASPPFTCNLSTT